MTAERDRALVVGSGYLGARVVRLLVRAGFETTGTARSDAGLARTKEAGGDALRLDLGNANDWRQVAAPFRTVVYAVAPGRGGDPELAWREGPRRLLEALASSPPGRIVFVSSTGVIAVRDGSTVHESAPATSMEHSHAEIRRGEESILQGPPGGPPGIVVRLGGLYGPGRSPLEWIRRAEFRARLGAGGDAFLNWIHIEDAAAVVASAALRGRPGAVYLATDGHPVPRREFWTRAAELAGVEPPQFSGGDGDLGKRCDPRRTLAELAVDLRFDWREGLSSLANDA